MGLIIRNGIPYGSVSEPQKDINAEINEILVGDGEKWVKKSVLNINEINEINSENSSEVNHIILQTNNSNNEKSYRYTFGSYINDTNLENIRNCYLSVADNAKLNLMQSGNVIIKDSTNILANGNTRFTIQDNAWMDIMGDSQIKYGPDTKIFIDNNITPPNEIYMHGVFIAIDPNSKYYKAGTKKTIQVTYIVREESVSIEEPTAEWIRENSEYIRTNDKKIKTLEEVTADGFICENLSTTVQLGVQNISGRFVRCYYVIDDYKKDRTESESINDYDTYNTRWGTTELSNLNCPHLQFKDHPYLDFQGASLLSMKDTSYLSLVHNAVIDLKNNAGIIMDSTQILLQGLTVSTGNKLVQTALFQSASWLPYIDFQSSKIGNTIYNYSRTPESEFVKLVPTGVTGGPILMVSGTSQFLIGGLGQSFVKVCPDSNSCLSIVADPDEGSMMNLHFCAGQDAKAFYDISPATNSKTHVKFGGNENSQLDMVISPNINSQTSINFSPNENSIFALSCCPYGINEIKFQTHENGKAQFILESKDSFLQMSDSYHLELHSNSRFIMRGPYEYDQPWNDEGNLSDYNVSTHLGLDWTRPLNNDELPDSPTFQMYDSANFIMRGTWILPSNGNVSFIVNNQYNTIEELLANETDRISFEIALRNKNMEYISGGDIQITESLISESTVLNCEVTNITYKKLSWNEHAEKAINNPIIEITDSSEIRIWDNAIIKAEQINDEIVYTFGDCKKEDYISFSLSELKALKSLLNS